MNNIGNVITLSTVKVLVINYKRTVPGLDLINVSPSYKCIWPYPCSSEREREREREREGNKLLLQLLQQVHFRVINTHLLL